MIGGLFMITGIYIYSLFLVKMIKENRMSWNTWVKIRNILLLVGALSVVPITFYEYHIGVFNNISLAVIINMFEGYVFCYGLFIPDVLLDKRRSCSCTKKLNT